VTPDSPTGRGARPKPGPARVRTPLGGPATPQTPGAGTPVPPGQAAPPPGGTGPAAEAGPPAAGSRRCKSCGRRTKYRQTRYGWCDACYTRWRNAGQPPEGPPPAAYRWVNQGRTCRGGCDKPAVKCGLCQPCYDRWRAAGRPDEPPPSKLSPAEKYEEFCWLRDFGVPREEAAQRVGISRPSSFDYDARRRA
jgi:hypothetical protein